MMLHTPPMTSPQQLAPSKKILIIDDESMIRQVLTIHLNSAGYEVACAQCASEGIELIRSGSFSLVITDYNLPDKSGMEVLRAAKNGTPNLPVMVMSGFLDAELIERIMAEGAAQYLRKPFLKAAVLAAVGNILNTKQDIDA